MAKKTYSNWAKSFGRSVKFGAKEVLSDIAPNMAETAGTLQDDVRELRQDLRKLRANKRQVVNYLLGEEENFSKYAQIGLKNAKSSLRTGKFIDPKRADKLTMEAMGFDDMDFGGGFDDNMLFDEDATDSFESAESDFGPSKVVNIMNGLSSGAIDSLSSGIAGTTEAISGGFDRLDRANKNAFAMSEALEKRFHSEKMAQLQAIDSNLVNIIQFNNENISTYVKASMEFYDKNLEVLGSINDAMLRISPVPKQKSERKYKESPVNQFMMGGFSLKGYADMVKNNTRRAFQNSMLGSMLPMVNNPMILADFAANPLGTLMKLGMEWMLPGKFSKSLTGLDRSFGNFIPALLTKFGHYSGNNEILSALSEVFGIKSNVAAKKFKQGEYERGAIAFDGETKAAITRVIPGYLSRQTALLELIAKHQTRDMPWTNGDFEDMVKRLSIVYKDSGGEGSGSFMRYTTAQTEQRNEEREVITRAYSDSRWDLRSKASEYNNSGIDRTSDIDNYLVGVTHSGDELKIDDLDQIKKFIWMGSHDGKRPKLNEYQSEVSDETAQAIQYALSKLENNVALGLYGRERHEARAALSNYNTYVGNEDEYGAGRNTYLSKVNRGSIVDLYQTADTNKIISYEWGLEKVRGEGDQAEYTMPPSKLEAFNEQYHTHFTSANQVYKFLQKVRKKEGKETLEAAADQPEEVTKTLTQRIKELINTPFEKMANLFDNVNQAMYKVIFGKDGLGGNLEELILGVKDEKGRRSGGWFSEAINGAKDTYTSAKNYLFGGTDAEGKPVEGILQNGMQKFSDLMQDYIFGVPEDVKDANGKIIKGKRKSVFETIQSTLVEGFGGLASTLFGNADTEEGRSKSLDEAKAAFKKAIPDIGKGAGLGAVVGTVSGLGGFGLLGSLFLPGGPIGGALVGGAMGLLSQSKAFREMLFGREETDANGVTKRVGGLISSDVIDWFKKKKTAIMGGASMGVISTALGHGIGFGLVPSIAVGAFGPVIAGAAWGVATHSQRFREMMFGKEVKDENGVVKRVGGLINTNMTGQLKKMLPRGIAGAISGVVGMGVISQMGLIGSMVATGPIPAAILGAGIGIASASKDFTQRMFGYKDEQGNYHSGALDRMKNFFTYEIFEPLKVRVQEELFNASMYIRKNVFRSIYRAVIPIKETFKIIGEDITNAIKEAFKPLKTGITGIVTSLADGIKAVMKPIISVVSTMSSWLFNQFKRFMKISIWTTLLPIRMVGGLARMFVEGRNYKSNVTEAFSNLGAAIRNRQGIGGALKNVGSSIFNPESAFKEHNELEKQWSDEDAKYELEQNSILREKRMQMETMREKIRANGYNLTDEQIAEKYKTIEQQAEAKGKLVDAGEQSKDLSVQVATAQLKENVTTNLHLTGIEKNTGLMATAAGAGEQATGTNKDDNAQVVDERNKAEEEKAKAAVVEERKATALEQLVAWWKKKEDPNKKKSWWDKLKDIAGGIGGVISGVFGLGKLIMAGVGIISAIKAFLDFKFGDNQTKKRMVESEAMGNIAEGGLKKTLFGVRAARKWLGTEITKTRTVASWIDGKQVGLRKEIVGTGKTRGQQIMEYAGNFKNKISKLVSESIHKPDNFKGPIDKILSAGKAAVDYISKINWIKNPKFPKAKHVVEVFDSIVKTMDQLLKTKTFRNKVLKFIGERGASGLLKGAGKTALGVLTGGAATVAFGVYDGITGAARAGFYFDVNDEDTDWRMRLIAGAINTFFGLPLMFAYDFGLSLMSLGVQNIGGTPFGQLLDKVGVHLANFDHRKAIAQLIYRMTGEEADSAKLDASQKKLMDEYKAHLKKTGEQISLEEFQTEVKGQGGFWKKFGSPILNRILGVDDNKPEKSFRERVHDAYEGLVKWFNTAIEKLITFNPLEYIKDKVTELFKPIKDRWDKFTDFGDNSLTAEGKSKSKGTWAKFKKGVANFFTRDKASYDVDGGFEGSGNAPAWYQSQNDVRWKDKGFGEIGCGPAVASMALGKITGKKVTPVETGKFAANHMVGGKNKYTTGIESGYFGDVASKYGVGYIETPKGKDMVKSLMSGNQLVVGGKSTNPNSPFYGSGHYVLADSMDAGGNVKIYNPTSRDKNTTMNIKDLVHQSIGSGGYAGSFVGGGRATLAEANKVINERVGQLTSTADLRRYEEQQQAVADPIAEDMHKYALSTNGPTSIADLRRMEESQAYKEKTAKAVKESTAKAKTMKPRTTTATKKTEPKPKLSLMQLLGGIGMGISNLFSSIWGGTKYKNVTMQDVLGGIGSFFGKRWNNIKVSGKGCDTGIRAAQCALAHPDGEQWMGEVTSDPNIQCDSYAREIYHEAGLDFPEKVVTDKDFKAKNAYHLNDGSYEPQLGDLIDWPKHVGIYVGGHNVNSRQSKGGVHTLSFEDAEAVWGPIVGFGSISDYTGEPVHEVHGGGGGSYDASEGHIETKKAVWNTLVNDFEINRAGAAGIMGNIEQESHFDVGAYNPNDADGNPSGGLVQWHAGRFNNLKDYAASINKPWDDVHAQMGYLHQELESGYKNTYDKIANAGSVEDAVEEWVRHFEIPADIPGEIERRTPMAQGFYDDHVNFMGGANGFMMPQRSGSSGMLLGNVLANSLFNWKKRYDERGRDKDINALKNMIAAGVPEEQIPQKLLKYKPVLAQQPFYESIVPEKQTIQQQPKREVNIQEAVKTYAANQVPPKTTYTNQITTPPVQTPAAKILPAKIDTGGATMDDLLLSIRALDSHNELNQIIAYLATIANNGGIGRGDTGISKQTEIEMKRFIDQAKLGARQEAARSRLSPSRFKDLTNSMDAIGDLSKDAIQLAVEIAKGGSFRKS